MNKSFLFSRLSALMVLASTASAESVILLDPTTDSLYIRAVEEGAGVPRLFSGSPVEGVAQGMGEPLADVADLCILPDGRLYVLDSAPFLVRVMKIDLETGNRQVLAQLEARGQLPFLGQREGRQLVVPTVRPEGWPDYYSATYLEYRFDANDGAAITKSFGRIVNEVIDWKCSTVGTVRVLPAQTYPPSLYLATNAELLPLPDIGYEASNWSDVPDSEFQETSLVVPETPLTKTSTRYVEYFRRDIALNDILLPESVFFLPSGQTHTNTTRDFRPELHPPSIGSAHGNFSELEPQISLVGEWRMTIRTWYELSGKFFAGVFPVASPRAARLFIDENDEVWFIESFPPAVVKYNKETGAVSDRLELYGPEVDLNRIEDAELSQDHKHIHVSFMDKPVVASIDRETGEATLLITGRPPEVDAALPDLPPDACYRIAVYPGSLTAGRNASGWQTR